MKKIYKYKGQKKYEDLSLILKDKSDYLKNLEKKRNDGIKIIKSQKARLMLENIFKINKFKRNYSCFPFNCGNENEPILFNINKNISQIVNFPFKQKIIKDYSNKKQNNVEIGKLPIIKSYTQIPKSKNIYKVRLNYNINNNRNKYLSKIGKEIINKNKSNHNDIRTGVYNKYKNI